MVTLATILDLPPDDDEAFLAFEEDAIRSYEDSVRNADREEGWEPFWLIYMTHVREAAREFGVESLSDLEVIPPIRSDEFAEFRHAVLAATTRLKFRVARRIRQEVIQPDTSDRERVRFRVQQLRKEIDGSALPQPKRDALNKKLEELEREFEGKTVNRAAVLVILAACAALVQQAQGVLLKGPETIVSIMDTINMVIGKEEQRRALLERYRKPLAIEDKSKGTSEHGKTKGPASREEFSHDLDDEIPF